MHAWYEALPEAAQAAVDAALENLADEDDLNNLPQLKQLRGKCEGLDELLIDLPDGSKYRILCFRGPNDDDLTLLFGFPKSPPGHVDYGPHCWSALKRKEGVIRDGRRAPSCRFP
jgi:hypothetical protein